jgi:hypothetical protein
MSAKQFGVHWGASCGLAVVMLGLMPGTFARTFFPNEDVYVSRLMHQTKGSLIRDDWTLPYLQPDRPLFDAVFTRVMELLGPTGTVQVGRPLGWFACIAAAMWLLRGLGFTNPITAMAIIFVWQVPYPYTVSQEWIFGAFESKTLAWASLLAMLAALGRGRTWLGTALCILTVGLHFGIGLWGALIFCVALLATSTPARQRIPAVVVAAAGSIAVSLPILRFILDSPAQSEADLQGWTRGLWSIHSDPFSFPPVLLVGLALVFVGSVTFHFGERSTGLLRSGAATQQPWRVLVAAELTGMALFAVGVLARFLDKDVVLSAIPFRVGPPLVALGGVARLAHVLRGVLEVRRLDTVSAEPSQGGWLRSATQPFGGTIALAAVALMLVGHFGPPAKMARYRVEIFRFGLRPAPTAEQRAAHWVSKNLPDDAVVAINPAEAHFGEANRRLVASLLAARSADLADWGARMKSLSGVDYLHAGRFVDLRDAVTKGYNERDFGIVDRWDDLYGVTHVVSPATYPLPLLAEFDGVKVYELAPAANPDPVSFDDVSDEQ